MPAFYLDDRFFFVPGFPEMAHPMLRRAMERFFPPKEEKIYRKTLTALTRESTLIDVMEQFPDNVELSSLPKLYSDGPRVTISLSSQDEAALEKTWKMLTETLEGRSIPYALGDENSS